MFENLIQINNSFLLIGLIIVAITCIYLLYSNLTKTNETTSLRTTVLNLIQQNKKRDEIINFLLERIENLEHVLPGPPEPTLTINTGAGMSTTAEPINDLDDIFDSAIAVQSSSAVDMAQSSADMAQSSADMAQTSAVDMAQTSTVVDEIVPTQHGEFDDLESEFTGLLENDVQQVPVPEIKVDECVVDTKSEVSNADIVSSILESADDIGLMSDVEINMSEVPKDKKKLNSKYNMKQLKTIAHKLALKTSGTKIELVDRVYSKLMEQ